MNQPRQGHVVIAPDKFKGSLTATEVARHVAAGLRRTRPDTPLVALPVADGGEGTVEAAVAAGFHRVETTVHGPTGERITASYAIRGDTAVIELAEASGLHRLPSTPPPTAAQQGARSAIAAPTAAPPDSASGVAASGSVPPGAPASASTAQSSLASGGVALGSSSYGVGELIDAAIGGGARRIVLGLGGSACTDGGVGMAAALGGRFLDANGEVLGLGGGALRSLASVDISAVRQKLRGVSVVVASDVDSPLLGPDGAAAVFGPQKGAGPGQVRILEQGLARLATVVQRDLGVLAAKRTGAGAAGGVGFGAMAFLSATVRPGITYLLDLLGFADQVAGARLVITGEGSLDRQSLRGKAPVGVARAAARAGVPVVTVSGRRGLTGEQLRRARIQRAYALTDIEPDPERCMAEAGPLLERVAGQIADAWLTESGGGAG